MIPDAARLRPAAAADERPARPDGRVVLRPATHRDGPRCAGIFLRARQAAFPCSRRSFELDDYQRAVEDDEVWVARIGGVAVGFVSLHRPERQIRNLFVDPRWQHRGIGSRLLDAARGLLDGPALLCCQRGNRAARSFYEHNGWTLVPGFEPETADTVVYRK